MLKSLAALLFAATAVAAQAGVPLAAPPVTLHDGAWRATLATRGGELPFGLRLQDPAHVAEAAAAAAAEVQAARQRVLDTPTGRIRQSAPPAAPAAAPGPAGVSPASPASGWRAWIVNGAEEIEIPDVRWSEGTLELSMPHYASRVLATAGGDGASLDGEWLLDRGGTLARLPFHARRDDAPRFAVVAPAAEAAPARAGLLGGTWSVTFADDEDPAVGSFRQAPDGTATGTFLTTTGDYRFLAGDARAAPGEPPGSGLRLSCFDGAHAFLFVARVQGDGTLAGDFWSRDGASVAWTARRDGNAALPDAFDQVHWKEGARLDNVAFPDMNGVKRSLADPAFAGKARIVQIFGSWCPNCADEALYLAELKRIYGPLGLSIVGIAFERTGEFERDAVQVRRFAEHRGVTWPLLVAGLANKEKATATLGLLDRIKGFPTTIFLHRDGRVAAVHSGYSGPATGDAHLRQRQEFAELVETLLAEP
ncbi:MAG TPA: TlpA disulfide reductase family protein [Planctomycetota bacterium]|nr:TlpA disulfide reductase family protein [Planctomycetota bacterium]